MKAFQIAFVFYLICVSTSCNTSSKIEAPGSQKGVTQFVNPFIGTAPLLNPEVIGYVPPRNWRVWAGLTYPGVSLPNAMVQLSPITEYGTGAGYQYEDTIIHGFTHTNKGHWNLCNIPILPAKGAPRKNGKYSSRFFHSRESAGPGFYNVYLSDYDVEVELTSTLRAGFHRYRYSSDKDKKVIFDLSSANNRVLEWNIEQESSNAISGFQRVHENKIYFYALFNSEIDSMDISGNYQDSGMAVILLKDGARNVDLKIGLSYVSTENAKENLDAEIGNSSFETIREKAIAKWDELLSRIEVKGGTRKQKELFYSSLYRAFLWPVLKSDINGEYYDVKGKVIKADFNYYTVPSLWDTYRNKVVLLAIMSPQVTTDVIKSMIDIGNKTGAMPTFFHGDHAASFITGSYLRGLTGFDINNAYQLLLKNANVEGPSRPYLNEYLEKGFISDPDIEHPHVETKGKAGVSKTLEYAYDDYSVGKLAEQLGDTENYKKMMLRSKNYENVFDKSTNFMRGKLANGEWIENFNPRYPYYEYMFREANAWQVSFYTPHDMQGLISLYGGAANFESKLDSLFTIPWNLKYIARNISGFIGQYCHGNQPDHEAPFSYYFINKPEKSQKIIDTVLNSLYGIGEHGLALCGMDDAGEMSSWYVFNALGLYPFSPADTEYLVTLPLFDEVQWEVGNGKTLSIRKKGNSRRLREIKVNNRVINGYFINHDLFRNGGSVEVKAE